MGWAQLGQTRRIGALRSIGVSIHPAGERLKLLQVRASLFFNPTQQRDHGLDEANEHAAFLVVTRQPHLR